jgi:pyruvate formate lyase activating enzyme
MLDLPRTPLATVQRAREIALSNGLRWVYTGNVVDWRGGNTWCPDCDELLVERWGYAITGYHLDEPGRCHRCGLVVPGHFTASPGHWGNRFEAVAIHR